jgi:hypothetical protein
VVIVRVIVAVVILVVIVRFGLAAMRHYVGDARELAERRDRPPETLAVADAGIRFHCATCGLEVLVTQLPELDEHNEMPALRHCREEMELVPDGVPEEELST